MTCVQVVVKLKDEILDVQGRTIALESKQLGFDSLSSVKKGSVYFLQFEKDEKESLKRARELAEKLLANSLVETFELSIARETGA